MSEQKRTLRVKSGKPGPNVTFLSKLKQAKGLAPETIAAFEQADADLTRLEEGARQQLDDIRALNKQIDASLRRSQKVIENGRKGHA